MIEVVTASAGAPRLSSTLTSVCAVLAARHNWPDRRLYAGRVLGRPADA
jgi:hypothetical protein